MGLAKGRRGCRYAVLGACASVVSVVVFTNLLWASTHSAMFSGWSSHSRESGPALQEAVTEMDVEEEKAEVPTLTWEEVAEAPVRRLDGAAVQIGSLLYVFAGYNTIDEVHSHVDVYDLRNNTWGRQIKMPEDMAHSHLGMVTDGRYIYIVTGQYGPQCRGATAANFVFDSHTEAWSKLLPLPVPRYHQAAMTGYHFLSARALSDAVVSDRVDVVVRYAPATQLWKGRLHVVGGSKENRREPALDHWSIAVQHGKALESEWRSEVPIPRGGPHRASVVVGDSLYVIGGQEGDFIAKPGSPIFKCSRQPETVYGDVYMLDDVASKWASLPPVPKPVSHIEFAAAVTSHQVITAGGSTEKNPVTKRMVLIGDVFLFDTKELAWRTLGQLPYRVKTALVAHWDGWLYVSSGQRDKGVDDPSPKKIVGRTWRTKLQL